MPTPARVRLGLDPRGHFPVRRRAWRRMHGRPHLCSHARFYGLQTAESVLRGQDVACVLPERARQTAEERSSLPRRKAACSCAVVAPTAACTTLLSTPTAAGARDAPSPLSAGCHAHMPVRAHMYATLMVSARGCATRGGRPIANLGAKCLVWHTWSLRGWLGCGLETQAKREEAVHLLCP